MPEISSASVGLGVLEDELLELQEVGRAQARGGVPPAPGFVVCVVNRGRYAVSAIMEKEITYCERVPVGGVVAVRAAHGIEAESAAAVVAPRHVCRRECVVSPGRQTNDTTHIHNTTHDTRHTTHDTRHTTHDTRHTTHDTRRNTTTRCSNTARAYHKRSGDARGGPCRASG
jgi:hypothetical protein